MADTDSSDSSDGSGNKPSSARGVPLSGTTIAIISSSMTILALIVGTGSIWIGKEILDDPKKAWEAVSLFLIPFFTLIIAQRAQIVKAISEFRNNKVVTSELSQE